MKTRTVIAFSALILAAGLVHGQQVTLASQPQASQTQSSKDPFSGSLFSPELVIQNQEAIGLSDEQKTYLRNEIRQAQAKFTDGQWKLQDEMERMAGVMKQTHVDEEQALAELEKVLSVEHEIKKQQVTLMVRIKNKLTVEQQAKLSEIRSKQD